MLDSEKFAIAARLHVVLRRKLGRVTDVDWMVRNREYAVEVLRISREVDDAEVQSLAGKFEQVWAPRPPARGVPRPELRPSTAPLARPAVAVPEPDGSVLEALNGPGLGVEPAAPARPRYLGGLR